MVNINTTDINDINRIAYKVKKWGNNAKSIGHNSFEVKTDKIDRDKLRTILGNDSSNVSVSQMLMFEDSTLQWTTNQIFVQVPSNANLSEILDNCHIPFSGFRQFGSDPQTYLVELSGIEDNSIKYSNVLYNSGRVIYAQPAFGRLIKSLNQYYNNQWALNNTGQFGGINGMDINIAEACRITVDGQTKFVCVDGPEFDGHKVDFDEMLMRQNYIEEAKR